MAELTIMEMGTVTEFNFVNKKLTAASKKIANAGSRMKEDMFKISSALAEVKRDKLYEDDGFKNVSEYAEKTFGFKKSLTYSLIGIGERFTVKIDKTHFGSKYADETGDYTTQQLGVLSSLDDEQIDELIDNREINKDMTIRELREIVKDVKENINGKVDDTEDVEITIDTESKEISSEVIPQDEKDTINEILIKLDFLKSRSYEVDDLMTAVRKML